MSLTLPTAEPAPLDDFGPPPPTDPSAFTNPPADPKAALDAKLPILRANAGVTMRISGHADERGSDQYNDALGQSRAAATKRYLTDNGIDGARISIVSYGEQQPATSGADESAWARNRRAEFEITGGGNNIVPPQ